MDEERLIEEIKKRPVLWDPRLKAHKNRESKVKLWSEVADILNTNRYDVQKKFKNLRDIFRREVKKFGRKQNVEDASIQLITSKWRLYEDMGFLKDCLDVRKRRKRIVKTEINNCVENYDSELSDSITDPSSEIFPSEDLIPQPTTTDHHKGTITTKLNIQDWKNFKSLELDVDSLAEILSTDYNTKRDDDYYFLISLYPYIKKMPELMKLQFRLKLQELLYNTMAEIEATNSINNSLQLQISYANPIDICTNNESLLN